MENVLKNLLLAYLLIPSTAFSQYQDISKRIDSLFQVISKYKLLNGATQIMINGHTIYKSSSGYSDFAGGRSNTEMTNFALGSVSKIFTSTAILQLRDKGKLKLDDYFIKYFPEFPYSNITIRQLLSHTSGLPDYGIFESAVAKHPEKVFNNADIIRLLRSLNQPLIFNPGEKWQYSNLNFCLLALLVEKISGVYFKVYVREKIFKPAGMSDTYFYTGKENKPINQAINHDYPLFINTKPIDADSIKKTRWRTYNLNGLLGQGNIYSTIADMIRFDQALYGTKLLKLESIKEAFTVTQLNKGIPNSTESAVGTAGYGLGWYVLRDTTFGKVVFHTGGVPGAKCMFVRNVTRKQSFILFDNAFSPNVFDIGKNILRILNTQPAEILRKTLTRDYVIALTEQGVDAAFIKLYTLKSDSLHYSLSEDEMNELGLQLLYAGKTSSHIPDALEILKLNVLLFPQSFNTYDSYGEALAFAGKKQEAIEMYRKSLELNHQNKGGQAALEQLLK
ncbi:serine hydrolase domain-containing protein [Pedobacter nyackensis]|uniref:serine hydrolase domain-containing protein n=1 Tax=Pedobacter nyackensis TaxID=475255 RepID=UPI00292D7F62|nr:serine hydrolase domain-containing protein [Pedobacter nyackensis]